MKTVKETELRIGNLVSQNGYPGLVYSIESALPRREERFNDKVVITLYDSGLSTVTLDQVSPVTITDDLLTRFGFQGEYNSMINIMTFILPGTPFSFVQGKFVMQTGTGDFCVYLKFAHQLQNLYFALVGEELTLN
jgi:hypothetical protein